MEKELVQMTSGELINTIDEAIEKFRSMQTEASYLIINIDLYKELVLYLKDNIAIYLNSPNWKFYNGFPTSYKGLEIILTGSNLVDVVPNTIYALDILLSMASRQETKMIADAN